MTPTSLANMFRNNPKRVRVCVCEHAHILNYNIFEKLYTNTV